jgi:hypothetical protein
MQIDRRKAETTGVIVAFGNCCENSTEYSTFFYHGLFRVVLRTTSYYFPRQYFLEYLCNRHSMYLL